MTRLFARWPLPVAVVLALLLQGALAAPCRRPRLEWTHLQDQDRDRDHHDHQDLWYHCTGGGSAGRAGLCPGTRRADGLRPCGLCPRGLCPGTRRAGCLCPCGLCPRGLCPGTHRAGCLRPCGLCPRGLCPGTCRADGLRPCDLCIRGLCTSTRLHGCLCPRGLCPGPRGPGGSRCTSTSCAASPDTTGLGPALGIHVSSSKEMVPSIAWNVAALPQSVRQAVDQGVRRHPEDHQSVFLQHPRESVRIRRSAKATSSFAIGQPCVWLAS